jgi:hypothetical protein
MVTFLDSTAPKRDFVLCLGPALVKERPTLGLAERLQYSGDGQYGGSVNEAVQCMHLYLIDTDENLAYKDTPHNLRHLNGTVTSFILNIPNIELVPSATR